MNNVERFADYYPKPKLRQWQPPAPTRLGPVKGVLVGLLISVPIWAGIVMAVIWIYSRVW